MAAKGALKYVLKLVSCRATDLLFSWRHRRRWLDKQGQGRLHEDYFQDYRTRLPIADAIADIIASSKIETPRIIEFGCSGGNNLKLLRERLSVPITFCGLDIQEDAIAFARNHFPDDRFYTVTGDDLAALKPQLGVFDIFLISGVLSYLPQKEAQRVFELAAELAEHLVVCDVTERFALSTGENDGLFLHPYRLMCEKAGFEIVVPPPADPPDRFAVFVAHRTP